MNAQVKKGDNVLITGIGGGVALLALQICLAHGANVYVSSGSEDKIRRAIALGAKGGVNYKQKDWPAQLEKLLVANHGKGALLDAVVDSGGGEIMAKVNKILRSAGKVVVYGMYVLCCAGTLRKLTGVLVWAGRRTQRSRSRCGKC